MNEDDFDFIAGQVSALFMTTTALITTLSPVQAAEVSAQLALSHQDAMKSDRDHGVPDSIGDARNGLLEAIQNLLQGVARRG